MLQRDALAALARRVHQESEDDILLVNPLPWERTLTAMVPDWVTASGYTEELTVRTKVGDEQGSSRVGILAAATGDATWLEAEPEGYEGGP